MARLTESQRETFEALRRAYLADVPARIVAIREAGAEVGRSGTSRAALEDLRQLVHQLVGSSAIFGLSRLSAAARALEDRLRGVLDGAPAAGEVDELAANLENVWKATAKPRSCEPTG